MQEKIEPQVVLDTRVDVCAKAKTRFDMTFLSTWFTPWMDQTMMPKLPYVCKQRVSRGYWLAPVDWFASGLRHVGLFV